MAAAGTLDYMPPEVLRCPLKRHPGDNKSRTELHYTTAVDSWAAGVLAYELLTGRWVQGGPRVCGMLVLQQAGCKLCNRPHHLRSCLLLVASAFQLQLAFLLAPFCKQCAIRQGFVCAVLRAGMLQAGLLLQRQEHRTLPSKPTSVQRLQHFPAGCQSLLSSS